MPTSLSRPAPTSSSPVLQSLDRRTMPPRSPLFEDRTHERPLPASLFPGTAVLAERHKWAAAVLDGKLEPRITLTYPLLESSRTAACLVAGSEKGEILARLLEGDRDLPSARLAAVGKMRSSADTAATGRSVP